MKKLSNRLREYDNWSFSISSYARTGDRYIELEGSEKSLRR